MWQIGCEEESAPEKRQNAGRDAETIIAELKQSQESRRYSIPILGQKIIGDVHARSFLRYIDRALHEESATTFLLRNAIISYQVNKKFSESFQDLYIASTGETNLCILSRTNPRERRDEAAQVKTASAKRRRGTCTGPHWESGA